MNWQPSEVLVQTASKRGRNSLKQSLFATGQPHKHLLRLTISPSGGDVVSILLPSKQDLARPVHTSGDGKQLLHVAKP
jgi:hypothetical protein